MFVTDRLRLSGTSAGVGQTLIGLTGSGLLDSTNVIDLSANRDIGIGEPIYIKLTFSTAVTVAGGGLGITILVVNSNTTALSGGGTDSVVVAQSPLFSTVAGVYHPLPTLNETIYIVVPPLGTLDARRYLGLVYFGIIAAAGTVDAGSVIAEIVTQPGMPEIYPDAI